MEQKPPFKTKSYYPINGWLLACDIFHNGHKIVTMCSQLCRCITVPNRKGNELDSFGNVLTSSQKNKTILIVSLYLSVYITVIIFRLVMCRPCRRRIFFSYRKYSRGESVSILFVHSYLRSAPSYLHKILRMKWSYLSQINIWIEKGFSVVDSIRKWD